MSEPVLNGLIGFAGLMCLTTIWNRIVLKKSGGLGNLIFFNPINPINPLIKVQILISTLHIRPRKAPHGYRSNKGYRF